MRERKRHGYISGKDFDRVVHLLGACHRIGMTRGYLDKICHWKPGRTQNILSGKQRSISSTDLNMFIAASPHLKRLYEAMNSIEGGR